MVSFISAFSPSFLFFTICLCLRDSEISISGGDFYSAEAGYLVDRVPNSLVVHRVTDWHGTTPMDMSPMDKTPHSWGLCMIELGLPSKPQQTLVGSGAYE